MLPVSEFLSVRERRNCPVAFKVSHVLLEGRDPTPGMEVPLCCFNDVITECIAERRLTTEIEKERLALEKLRALDVKTLLLGCASSGKSTFMKQVRRIQEGGFSEEERMSYKPIICQNIIISSKMLINAVEFYGYTYESKNTWECARIIKELEAKNVNELNEEVLISVKQIWEDASIQLCYELRDELYLLDSTKYYMERLDRIGAGDYLPTEEDIVHSRSPTTSIFEYRIPVENYEKKLCIVDVGGQRSERPKWVHCFENCVAFIFISAISEYNQKNENGENRLGESIALFKVLLTCSAFRFTSVIVFLNKVDIFDEKIMRIDLSTHFPEYKGPANDSEKAKEFFRDIFQDCCQDTKKKVYARYTCATDIENMKAVFSTVQDYIMRKMLQQFNVM